MQRDDPNSFFALFRGGAEGKIRTQLIKENLLDAVIGLPPNLFYGTGIPAAILIFKRNKPDDTVLFIDASREFGQENTQNVLRSEDQTRILDACQQRTFIDKYAYVATPDELAENDYNLNIPRYVDTFEPEPLVDIAVVNGEIRALHGKLSEVEIRMEKYLEELGLNV